MSDDLILGIETSCDDTSVAIVTRDGDVLGIETNAQYDIHAEYGGIYPELASRAHLHAILPTIKSVMTQAGVEPKDLRALAVTRGPGLIGSLLVGVSTAQALSLAWDLPLIGVNHLRGHIRSVELDKGQLSFPALILLVSGGHSLLAHAKDPWAISLLGSTRDDSVGEAYDKVARMMGRGMPGGREIDAMAQKGRANIPFPRPLINEGYEFSFSGLKSSVARYLEQNDTANHNDVAASFVDACLEVLVAKLKNALRTYPAASFAVVGGVAASARLRERMIALSDQEKTPLFLPPPKWATDNGAMIALAAWDYLEKGVTPPVNPMPNLKIDEI